MFEHAARYNDYLEDVEIPEPASMYYRGNHGSVATRGENDDYISFSKCRYPTYKVFSIDYCNSSILPLKHLDLRYV